MLEGGAGEQAGLAVMPEAFEDLVLLTALSFRAVGQQAAQNHHQASQGPNERPSGLIARPLPLVVVACFEQQQALAIEAQPARPLLVQRRRGPSIQGDEAEFGIAPEGALQVQLQRS